MSDLSIYTAYTDKISTARDAGYSDDEILGHINKKIETARSSGYSDEEINSFLGIKTEPVDNAGPVKKFLTRDMPNIGRTFGARIGVGYQEGAGGMVQAVGEGRENVRQASKYENLDPTNRDDINTFLKHSVKSDRQTFDRLKQEYIEAGEVPEMAESIALSDVKKIVAGAPSAYGDQESNKAIADYGAEVSGEGRMLRRHLQGTEPLETKGGQLTAGAIESIGQMAPSLAAGVATGNPAIALAGMGGMTAAQVYGQSRANGISQEDSMHNAAIQGSTESLTEMIPLAKLGKMFKPGKLVQKTIDYMISEVPGEMLATAIQNSSDVAFSHEPGQRAEEIKNYLTSKKFVQDEVDTVLQTLIQGGMMAGAGGVTAKTGQVLTRKPQIDKTKESNLGEIADATVVQEEPVDDTGQLGDVIPEAEGYDPVQHGMNEGQFGEVVTPQEDSQVVDSENVVRRLTRNLPAAQGYAEPVYAEPVQNVPGDAIQLRQGASQRDVAGALPMPESRRLSRTPNIATEGGILPAENLNEFRNTQPQSMTDEQLKESQVVVGDDVDAQLTVLNKRITNLSKIKKRSEKQQTNLDNAIAEKQEIEDGPSQVVVDNPVVAEGERAGQDEAAATDEAKAQEENQNPQSAAITKLTEGKRKKPEVFTVTEPTAKMDGYVFVDDGKALRIAKPNGKIEKASPFIAKRVDKLRQEGNTQPYQETTNDLSEVQESRIETGQEVQNLRTQRAVNEETLSDNNPPTVAEGSLVEFIGSHSFVESEQGRVGKTITDADGRVTGRIPSSNPQWVQEAAAAVGGVEKLRNAVAKSVAGEKLGKNQAEAVRMVTEQYEQSATEFEEQSDIESLEKADIESETESSYTLEDWNHETDTLAGYAEKAEKAIGSDAVADILDSNRTDGEIVKELVTAAEGKADGQRSQEDSQGDEGKSGQVAEGDLEREQETEEPAQEIESKPDQETLSDGDQTKLFATPPSFGKKKQPDTHVTTADLDLTPEQGEQNDLFVVNEEETRPVVSQKTEDLNDKQDMPSKLADSLLQRFSKEDALEEAKGKMDKAKFTLDGLGDNAEKGTRDHYEGYVKIYNEVISILENGDSSSESKPAQENKEQDRVHSFSNTQVSLPGAIAEKITAFGKKIPNEELYIDENDPSYGREDEPHITVRYGLSTDNPADIKQISEVGPINVTLGDVSIFETDNYDVVKVDIRGDSIRAANRKVGELVDLPGETFTDYKPHATIAYVKKGEGKKYVGNKSLNGEEATFNEVMLVDRDGKEHSIELNKIIESVAESVLIDVNLLKNIGGKWKYKSHIDSGFLTASRKEDAVSRATEAYWKTPENKRLTRDERFDLADKEEFERTDSTFGHLSEQELREKIESLGGDIDSFRRAGKREFNNNGGRRTSAAVAAQGARDSAEVRMRLERFYKKKFGDISQQFHPDDLDRDKVIRAYSGTSTTPSSAAKMEQESYVNFMDDLKDDMEKDLPDGNEQLLNDELAKIKDEYLKRRYSVFSKREHVVSAHVAGGSKFNHKQSERRGSVLDEAESAFLRWQNSVRSSLSETTGVASVRRKQKEQVAEKKRKAKIEVDRREKESKQKQNKLPIVNYPGDFKEMTKTEWSNTSKDYKSINVSEDGTHRYRSVLTSDKGGTTNAPVFLTDSRVVNLPDAKKEQSEDKKTSDSTSNFVIDSIEAWNTVNSSLNDGEISIDQFKAAFQAVIDNKETLIADLNSKTKPQLFKEFPGIEWRYKNEKKDRVVGAAYSDMVTSFNLSGTISYGMGKDSLQNAVKSRVDSYTDNDLKEHAEAIAKNREEHKAYVEQQVEAIKDPKTLDDYITYLRAKISDGMTLKNARLTLSPEKRAEYDNLSAAESRGKRKQTKDDQRNRVQTAGQTVDGEIIETTHTKKGHDLFVVQLAERVSREDYINLNSSAKKLGGYYSKFRGSGAVPGFQFKSMEDAEAFKALAGGDSASAQETVKAKRDAFEDDKSQSASERLTTMADALEERAETSLNQERKTNTNKRAAEASRADENARAAIAMAKTMRKIADGISGGSVKFLDRIRHKTQIDYLSRSVGVAKWQEGKAKLDDKARDSYQKRLEFEAQPPTAETADYAEFPSYTAFRSDLATMGRKLLDVDGTKKLGQNLLKVADDVTKTYLDYAKDNINKVAVFARKDGSLAAFKTKRDAELSIHGSGFKGQAIALPVKRGENLIILSPSEAIKRGAWEGDNDKRITLSVDFGSELVEKMGKAAKRGKNVEIPWQFETAHERRKMLKRMGIETPAEFRAALREYIEIQEQPEQADKVKELERKMVGRKKDGLDFFPTPAGVADEMIETADINEGMSVLEPSAGMGHIADRIRETGVEPDVVEMSGERRELLEAKGYNLVGHDFLDLETGEKYDRIIMNPPFSDRRDAQHVSHAYNMLKPDGRLVAIVGEGVFFGSDKKAAAFREWVEEVGGTDEKLEDGTFQDPSLPVNTSVAARMVVIDKQPGNAPLFSIQEGKPSGSTVEQVEKELHTFLGVGFKRLQKLGKLRVVQSATELKTGAQSLFAAAYHGSPHRFDRFSTENIGTGEGVQAYGYGLYFAGSRDVAQWYRESLTRDNPYFEVEYDGDIIGDNLALIDGEELAAYYIGIYGMDVDLAKTMLRADRFELESSNDVSGSVIDQAYALVDKIDTSQVSVKKPGNLYQVELAPAEDEYLLWDKPLSEQSEKVTKSLESKFSLPSFIEDFSTAREFYQSRVRKYNSAEKASSELHALGIRGIKYLDGTSRGKGEGDHNYVIFNDADIEITALYSKKGDVAGVYEDGTVTLVSDMIGNGEAEYLMRHEGLHQLFAEDPLFKKKRADLLSQFEKLRETNKKVQAAFDRVPENTREGYETEEALAYFVQEPSNNKHSLYHKIVATVKDWMMRLGIKIKNFTAADMAIIITKGVKRYSKKPNGDDPGNGKLSSKSSKAENPDILYSKVLDKADEALTKLEGKVHGTPDVYTKNFGYNTTLGSIRETLKKMRGSDINWRQKLLDRYDPIKTMLGEDAYRSHRLLGNHGNVLVTWLEHGDISLDGGAPTVTGKNDGFLAWYESLGQEEGRKLLSWIAVKRAEQLEREGRENWLTPDRRKELLDWIGNSQDWIALNKKFQSYNKEILDLAEESELISKEGRAAWESDIYIPFYREDGQYDEDILHPQKSKRHVSAQIKRLKGGEMKINDLLENTLRNWGHLIQESQRNIARKRAVEVGREIGIIEDVGKQELYLSSKAARKENFIISYADNGERTFVRVDDPGLFNALSEVNLEHFSGPVMRAFGFAKRTLTYGATFGPAFRVANAFRDTLHTAVISESFAPFIDTFKGMVQTMRKSDDYIALMGSGGGFGQGYLDANDPKAMSRQIKKIAKREGEGAVGRILDTPRKLLAAWEHIGHISEMAARTQLYTNLKAKGKSHEEAAYEARDILDFGLSGDAVIIRAAISTIPFLNARFQGLDRMVRGAKANPKAFAVKGTLVAMASLALWSLFKDDDRYKELEDWEKWSYHHFWIGDYHYRLPKAFEVGAIFSSLPEALADIVNDNEESDYFLDFMLHTATQTFSLNYPAAISPGLEVWSNRSFFTGRAIEDMGDLKRPAGLRSELWTSETLKLIGEQYNVSPKKMQTLLRGHFGTFGMFMLGLSDIAAEQFSEVDRPAKKIDQYPLVGRFVREPEGRTKYATRLHEVFNEIEELSATVNHYKNAGDLKLARKAAEESRELWGLRKFKNNVQKNLKNLRLRERDIWALNISADKKRQRLDEIAKKKREIYKKAYDIVEKNR